MKETIFKSSNEASERLVAVNFQGLLPCYIASEIHMMLQQSKVNIIGDAKYQKEIYDKVNK